MRITRFTYFLITVSLIGFLSFPAQAANIEGTYDVNGTNPGGNGRYNGTATIIKTGQTYQIKWNVGSIFFGTGIVTGNVLSVSYTDDNREWFGTGSYRINDGGDVLQGSWCKHGGKTVGTDLLIKKH